MAWPYRIIVAYVLFAMLLASFVIISKRAWEEPIPRPTAEATGNYKQYP